LELGWEKLGAVDVVNAIVASQQLMEVIANLGRRRARSLPKLPWLQA
jgi:hypothetical protein